MTNKINDIHRQIVKQKLGMGKKGEEGKRWFIQGAGGTAL
jgi:hypothetical protein